IAQSRCAFHSPVMANYWMHNGFLQVEGEKMSKSLGNFFTIRELLADWPGAVLRFQMLSTHYRQPMDWTRKGSEEAAVTLDSMRVLTQVADASEGRIDETAIAALSDDLNTPLMIASLHKLLAEARKSNYQAACDLRATLAFLGIQVDDVNIQELIKRR